MAFLVHRIAGPLLFSTLAACSSVKVVSWTEDAQLADGRMITVKRTQEFHRVTDAGAGFQTGWLLWNSTISAKLPSPVNREVAWEGSLVPMLIDILPSGKPVLVGYAQTGRSAVVWGLDRSQHYVAFIAEGDWMRVPLDTVPASFHANLLGATYELFTRQGAGSGMHLDMERKRKINSDSAIIRRAKEIVR